MSLTFTSNRAKPFFNAETETKGNGTMSDKDMNEVILEAQTAPADAAAVKALKGIDISAVNLETLKAAEFEFSALKAFKTVLDTLIEQQQVAAEAAAIEAAKKLLEAAGIDPSAYFSKKPTKADLPANEGSDDIPKFRNPETKALWNGKGPKPAATFENLRAKTMTAAEIEQWFNPAWIKGKTAEEVTKEAEKHAKKFGKA